MLAEFVEKDGKIYSHLRKIWLVKKPEELVRQKFLFDIITKYDYKLDQIAEEQEITGSGSAQARADFVIWKTSDDRSHRKPPFIVVECKADNVTINKDVYYQGEHYARMTGAPFFVTHNNKETKYWRVKKDKMPGYIEEIEDIPHADSTEEQVNELLSKLKVFKEDEFAELLHQCHNIIRNREKLDPAAAFDEIAKILFMKVYAERNLKSDMKGNIFTLDYIEEGEKFNPEYIEDIFEKTKREFGKDKIFGKNEKINLRINTIKSIIQKLEKYNLSATSNDIKGIAFERFLGRTFRGEIGQFFTPRPIVDFMVKMMEPKYGDIICDPASGSGGFLIQFFEVVREQLSLQIDEEYKKEKARIESQENLADDEKAAMITKIYETLNDELSSTRKNSKMWKLSNCCIFGTDANERMARTSKMNMIMHGDGHGGIHHHDGFLNINGIFEERFDLVLTNPPFGQNVEKDDTIIERKIGMDEETKQYYKKIYGDAYEKSYEKIKSMVGEPISSLFNLPKGDSIKTEILFIERCLSLLKPGGKLGIVLPEGILNNPSLSYVREFAENKAYISAVISLPEGTFLSSGATVKASLVFMQKFFENEVQQWNSLLEKAKNETSINKQEDRITPKKSKFGSKRAKINESNNQICQEARKNAKEKFEYFIFMTEADHVGITSTGEEDINELPNVLEQYLEFKRDPIKFVEKVGIRGNI